MILDFNFLSWLRRLRYFMCRLFNDRWGLDADCNNAGIFRLYYPILFFVVVFLRLIIACFNCLFYFSEQLDSEYVT